MTISRETRIKIRSEMYAKGEIDLQTFFDLESMDEAKEEPGDLTGLSEADNKKHFPDPETVCPKPTSTKIRKKSIKITKEDFDKLSIRDQQTMYDEDPEAVEALVKGD